MGLGIDIGIGVIILIAAIVGLIKGFHNQFTKGFCSFVALCAAIALAAIIAPLIRPFGFYTNLQNTATGWFTAEYLSVEVHSAEELSSVLEGTTLAILAGASDQIFGKMQESQIATLGKFFGSVIINVIAAFIIWLILYLILKFALYGVRVLLKKASEMPVLKSIDKIFGFIWAEVITYLIVIVFILTAAEIVIIQFIPSAIEPVRNIIGSSHILSFLHNFNLGSVLARFLGLDLTALTPVAVG